MRRERKKDFFNRTIEEGKRYTVEWAWDSRKGHIISAYKENGTLTFYDPQSSKKYTYEEFRNKCLNNSVPGTVQVMRVDNCEFNPEIVNYILKGKSQ